MAESSSAAASTSTAPNSDYDVFINHRGPDVKKTFASHLYRRLHSYGLRVFLDQPELQQGDYLTPQIEGAIESASVHVAIFSSGYAESTWCLKELVLMLESNSPIIPVFYRVKPAELRWAQGGYARALRELEKKKASDPQTREEKLRYDSSMIENWRDALFKVAGISGFELEACNGDEGELLDKVVEGVLKKVKKPALDVAKHPTGLDDKVNDFENTVLLPRQQSGKPQILGIVGLGGVGKTTLAKELFNRKSSGYSRSCFLCDVRDHAGKGSLNLLQRELLKTLTGRNEPIASVHEGKTILKKDISSPNLLIILDDVDKVDQVDDLLPDQTVLHSDSLILITSRNKDVLKRSGVEESSIYNLTGLTRQHSLELFSLYSFNQLHPLPEFESLVEKFIEACGGLPLSLKVFGALLNGENTSYWEAQLDKLQRILPEDIKQTLQISYDALDMEDRQIFLDITCFFIGEKRDMVTRIWSGSGLNGLCGFRNIQNKCLIEVDRANRIRMHDHLRDLGREIADASLPRRLWRPTEKIDDLLQQSSVINEVRGIRMRDHTDGSAMPWYQRSSGLFRNCVIKLCNMQYPSHGTGICMRNLQLLDTASVLVERILTKVQSPNLIWLRWRDCPYSSLPSSISTKNLRVLRVQGRKLKTLWKNESQAPLQLQELEIYGPLSNIPKSIGKLKHLERIVIEGKVNLTQLPKEFCLLQSLKALVLKGCSEMKSLPECFGNLTNLQQIILSDFRALERLPESLGNLTNLQQIQLYYCSALERLPESLGNLTNLQDIYLNESFKLERLPESLGNLTNLQQIRLSYCRALERLPESLGNLTNLQQISLSGSRALERLPDSLGNLTNLQQISLSGSRALERLPDSLGNLTNLQQINLRRSSALERLPDSFCKLIKLQNLNLSYCTNLTMSSETLGNISTLERIDLTGCGKIEGLPQQVTDQRSLKELRLQYTNIKELPSAIGELSNLEVMTVGALLDTPPPSLWDLKNLKELGLYEWKELKCMMPSLRLLTQLTQLTVQDCPLVRELPFKEEVKGKRETSSDLDSSIHILPRLQQLRLYKTGISEISFAEGVCCNLRYLTIYECNDLVEVGTLPNTLIWLSFLNCSNLRKIDQIYGLAKLQMLDLSGCTELEEVEGIQHCMALSTLYAEECPKLQWSAGVVKQLCQRGTYLKIERGFIHYSKGCLHFPH